MLIVSATCFCSVFLIENEYIYIIKKQYAIKILLVLSVFLHVFSMQSQQFHWAAAATGTGYEYGTKATYDAAGNTYIIGYSIGNINTTTNTFTYNGINYPTIGRGDVFFAKLDTNKQLVWMKQ